MNENIISAIEKIFCIRIEKSEYYIHALTHTSYTKENDLPYDECYERLEFLGDAVLKLIVSNILYNMYPDYSEGEMSKIRSIIVSDATLAQITEETGIDKYIIAGKHDTKQGVTKIESVRACAFEALLGAYYLDGRFPELMEFLGEILLPYIKEVDNNFAKYNAKAILQEYTQGLTKETPVYNLIDSKGPDHNKTFEVEVLYQNKVIASGEGKTKKDAEQKAAYAACIKLGAIKDE